MRNNRAAIALLLTGLSLVQAPWMPAQQPAQQPPAAAADTLPKFTSNTQLVVEIVSVKDKDGKVIEGLTAKDFVITENGVPQTISFCEFQSLDEKIEPVVAPPVASPSAPTPPPAERPKVDPIAAPAIAGAAPGDIKYRDRRLMVIYFDMSAMPVPDQLRSLTSARTFVQKQMTKADLLAIMKFEGGAVRVMQDFTDDRDTLFFTIDKMIAAEGQGFDPTDPETAGDTGAAFGQNDAEFNIFNTDRQLSALQTAVRMLGTLNEKKALMYFASGMQLSGVDNQAQMRATVNAAVRANVSLFPIDARGLVAMAPMGDATRGSTGGVGMYSGQGAMAFTNNFQRSQDTMYALAADTGGKALLDVNDLTIGMQNAQKAISSYYIIGYYTTNQNLDGKFRKVAVSMADKTLSAKLDFRSGYFAGKTFAKYTTADKERQLEDALMLGDPITDLTIQMEVNYFQLNRAEYYVPVVMKIPGSELALARRGGAEHTVIDFIGEIKDEYGTTVQNIRDKVDIKLTGETAAELMKKPIQYDSGYTLLPGSYTIKVLARDAETGRIGTYLSKFVIPNLNKEDKRVPISSVVLSSQRVALADSLYTAGKDKAQFANPLVQEGQKLIPSVTRVFSKQRDMFVYLQAYQQGVEKITPVVAYVTFYRGQSKAFETPPLPVTEGIETRLKTVPLKFSISLAKLTPGRYNCQVTVIDPTTQKANYWQAPVMLVP
jgi:VWFA-related protein